MLTHKCFVFVMILSQSVRVGNFLNCAHTSRVSVVCNFAKTPRKPPPPAPPLGRGKYVFAVDVAEWDVVPATNTAKDDPRTLILRHRATWRQSTMSSVPLTVVAPSQSDSSTLAAFWVVNESLHEQQKTPSRIPPWSDRSLRARQNVLRTMLAKIIHTRWIACFPLCFWHRLCIKMHSPRTRSMERGSPK